MIVLSAVSSLIYPILLSFAVEGDPIMVGEISGEICCVDPREKKCLSNKKGQMTVGDIHSYSFALNLNKDSNDAWKCEAHAHSEVTSIISDYNSGERVAR